MQSGNASHRAIRLLAALLALAAVACAHGGGAAPDADPLADDFFEDDGFLPAPVPDPLEDVNRPIFAGNMAIDRALIDPVARFYGFVAPEPLKQAVRGVFSNLNRPVVFVNELLQLEARRAATTLGRFVLNSTLGAAGMLDPATELGWRETDADFGQTLGKYGVGPGLYLVLPLAGPSTARDAVGGAVDLFLRLDTWFLPLGPQLLLGGGLGISERESRREEIDELRRSSLDFYAAVRSAYLQTRAARVEKARER